MSQGILAVVSAIVGGLIVGVFNYLQSDREMRVQMVQIAVGILSAQPDENIKPAREWAVDVINEYSAVDLTPGARTALLNNSLDGWVGGYFSQKVFIAPPVVPDARIDPEMELLPPDQRIKP